MQKRLLLILPFLAMACSKSDRPDKPDKSGVSDPAPPIVEPQAPLAIPPHLTRDFERSNCSDFDTQPTEEDQKWVAKKVGAREPMIAPEFPAVSLTGSSFLRKERSMSVWAGGKPSLAFEHRYEPFGHTESIQYSQGPDQAWLMNWYYLKNYKLSEHSRLDLSFMRAGSDECTIYATETSEGAEGRTVLSRSWKIKRDGSAEGGWRREPRLPSRWTAKKTEGGWTILLLSKIRPDGTHETQEELRLTTNSSDEVVGGDYLVNQNLHTRYQMVYDAGRLVSMRSEFPNGSGFQFSSLIRYDWEGKRWKSIVKTLPDYQGQGDSSNYEDSSGVFRMAMVPFDPTTCLIMQIRLQPSCFIRMHDELEYFGLTRSDGLVGELDSVQWTQGFGDAFSIVIPGEVRTGTCTMDENGMDCKLRTERKRSGSLSCQSVDPEQDDFWSKACVFEDQPELPNPRFKHWNQDFLITRTSDRWIYEKKLGYDNEPSESHDKLIFNKPGKMIYKESKTVTTDAGQTKEVPEETCFYVYDETGEHLQGYRCENFRSSGSLKRMEVQVIPLD